MIRSLQPAELQWPAWIEGQLSKVTRAIPILAQRTLPDPEGEVLGLDGIAAAVALWYADLRAKDANWRELEGGAKLNEVSGGRLGWTCGVVGKGRPVRPCRSSGRLTREAC